MGGMDAFGGFGGMGGMPLCSPLEGDCAEPALYVSPSGSDHADGSAEAPLATLGRALTLAGGRGLSIYACATLGPYVETLQLGPEHAGLRLLGGADCEDFSPTGARTHLVAQEASGHRIVGVSDVVLSRFTLTSPDAEEPGQSSIGLWISASDAVRLEQSVVSAGDGADGQAGESLPNPAESGADGNPGTDACVVPGDSLNLGGLAVTTTCQGVATVSSGGRGGSGGGGLNTPSGGAGEDGTPEDGGGLAGSGEAQSGGTACEDGGKGSPGGAGNAGAPAPQVGLLDASGYYPTLGHSGTDGTVGGGGGGGGGAKQAASPACPTGASGGSGGGGGCPGVGAGGGQSGGGSFGIVSYQSSLALQDVTVTVGLAGQVIPPCTGD